MTSVEDAKLLVQYGQHNRRMGSTLLNQSSSRSHCIFTIKLIRLMDTNRPKQAIVNRYGWEGGRERGRVGELLEVGREGASTGVGGREGG